MELPIVITSELIFDSEPETYNEPVIVWLPIKTLEPVVERVSILVVWVTSIWEEPLTTKSEFSLSFTLESKFVIVSAFTCDEPLNTLSPLISKYRKSKDAVNCSPVEPDTTLSPLVFKNSLSSDSENASCAIKRESTDCEKSPSIKSKRESTEDENVVSISSNRVSTELEKVVKFSLEDERIPLSLVIWTEDEITLSKSNLVFTLESKLVIVSASTWDDPLNTLSPLISKYRKSKDAVNCSPVEPLTRFGLPVISSNATESAVTPVNSEPSPLNPTDEDTCAFKMNDCVASSHIKDFPAPSISIPLPSASAELVEPLATVISLSLIYKSEVCISVAVPNTVKSPLTITLPLAVISLKVTFEVFDKSWLITSSCALFEWVCESPSKESNRESTEDEWDVKPVTSLICIWEEPDTKVCVPLEISS